MGELGKRIEQLRKNFDMSQEELSKKIGISRVTLSKIENNERKINIDEIQKFSEVFGKSISELLDPSLEAKIVLEDITNRNDDMDNVNSLRINVPQNSREKFEQVLLYILSKVGSKPNVGETVIYKLLYFIDFDYYERYEEQLIGATYQKNTHGPTPKEFKTIVDQMEIEGKIEKIKSKYYEYPQKKYLPLVESDLGILSGQEIKHIDSVLERHSNKSAKELSEYSHGDIPWMSVKDGENIEYEAVFYRTPEYSVRKYDE